MTTDVKPQKRYVAQIMGMPITLALRGRHTSDSPAHEAWVRIAESLLSADDIFSTYSDSSEISRLNAGTLDLRDCPADVHEVLELGRQAEERTNGYFSFQRFDEDGRTFLDPLGLVKGWAVERAARIAASLPDTSYCLSAGGDMVCHTTAARSDAWQVGIEDPHAPDRVIAVVPLRRASIATSGSAHRGAHIIDPHTGLPSSGPASVSVIGPSLMWADVYATAACARGREAIPFLESVPGYVGFVVHRDGSSTTVAA